MTEFRWPVARPIDLASYPRRNVYRHFLTFEIPVVTRTLQFDVSALLAHVKERKIRFSLTLGFVLTRAVNHVPEMRHRILNGELVDYDKIIPSITILGPDKNFYFSRGVFSDCFADDYPSNVAIIDRAALGLEPNIETDNKGQIFITNNPWNSFTSLSFPYSSKLASIPVFGVGKIYQDGGKSKAPFAMQTHHSLVDGYHVGLFLDILQRHLDNPDLIEKPFSPAPKSKSS
ncbi:CatA-like O-acetyltransferase [Aestuariivirga sp.]|jgi:chloramphenicol O-acetyltransferase type A|uniref:CatA-like O-acetyltransferase n=1 Tax=Aestuariivirga sp. TaxID=2650926 RepID=UPI003782EC08